MKIGIIGCGAIGTSVLKHTLLNFRDHLQIYIYDNNFQKTNEIKKGYPEVRIKRSLNSIVKECNFLIESASIKCVHQLLPVLNKYPRDVLFMSVGGLLGKDKILTVLRQKGKRIIIPSGAIAGIDGVKTLSRWGIKKLILKTFKPFEVLAESPYITKNKIRLKNSKNPQLVFKGSVKQAIKAFPRSINVSATLLIYSELKDFEVQVYASPEREKIIHIIEIFSDISTLTITCHNFPSSENPRTSSLAIASACMEVKNYIEESLNI
ncbi:MAG: DUF108 domain-containing protein [Candidatus Omnitrophica bacterium]|nr:DUF108 domain-containing protein [Candidatus Omnitrophota bacterium]